MSAIVFTRVTNTKLQVNLKTTSLYFFLNVRHHENEVRLSLSVALAVVIRTAQIMNSSSNSTDHQGTRSQGDVQEHEPCSSLVVKVPSTARKALQPFRNVLCFAVFLFSAMFLKMPPAMANQSNNNKILSIFCTQNRSISVCLLLIFVVVVVVFFQYSDLLSDLDPLIRSQIIPRISLVRTKVKYGIISICTPRNVKITTTTKSLNLVLKKRITNKYKFQFEMFNAFAI